MPSFFSISRAVLSNMIWDGTSLEGFVAAGIERLSELLPKARGQSEKRVPGSPAVCRQGRPPKAFLKPAKPMFAGLSQAPAVFYAHGVEIPRGKNV